MEQFDRNLLVQKRGIFLKSGIFFNDIETNFHAKSAPAKEKILQFGEGNFLRAFVDYFIDILVEKALFNGSIVVIQPIKNGQTDVLNAQQGCYTVITRGLDKSAPVVEKRIVTSISRGINPYIEFDTYLEIAKNPHIRFIISNTTEAGISFLETDKPTDTPPVSFPAKVVIFLYERYKYFNGDTSRGFIFIPCELIDNNGNKLKEVILQYARHWKLDSGFAKWIEEANYFTNTLVDRIVPGYPKDETDTLTQELGYEDKLLTVAEPFHFFAIEATGDAAKELSHTLPFNEAGLNALVTDDVTPYKIRKVRILNGAHTMSALAALLCGMQTVSEMVSCPLFSAFIKKGIYDEILPSLDDAAKSFADSVFDRFANPFIKHYLKDISLNSVSKFKARVLPSILDYYSKKNEPPEILTLSFAALITFYKKGMGTDSDEILAFFKSQPDAESICAKVDYWGVNLNELTGFKIKLSKYLEEIDKNGMEAVIKCSL